MSHRVSPQHFVADAGVQAGCWANLFGLRKRGGSAKSKAAQLTRREGDAELVSHPSSLPIRALTFHHHPVQIPYVHFGHGWYDLKYDSVTIDSCLSEKLPEYSDGEGVAPEVLQTIQAELEDLSQRLRELSLDIWRE